MESDTPSDDCEIDKPTYPTLLGSAGRDVRSDCETTTTEDTSPATKTCDAGCEWEMLDTIISKSSGQPNTTGLFDLPMELREMIYEYYFEDPYPNDYEVDLEEACKAPELLPSDNITLVCKQLRAETFDLCTTAQLDFWHGHEFYIMVQVWHFRDEDTISRRAVLKGPLRNIPALTQITFKSKWKQHAHISAIRATGAKCGCDFGHLGRYWNAVWFMPWSSGGQFNREMLDQLYPGSKCSVKEPLPCPGHGVSVLHALGSFYAAMSWIDSHLLNWDPDGEESANGDSEEEDTAV